MKKSCYFYLFKTKSALFFYFLYFLRIFCKKKNKKKCIGKIKPTLNYNAYKSVYKYFSNFHFFFVILT